MVIDMRTVVDNKIESIIFGGGEFSGEFKVTLLYGYSTVSIDCSERLGDNATVDVGDIPNLIKALKKALQVMEEEGEC